eukprot:Stramenopile-MAST_4_protein_2785
MPKKAPKKQEQQFDEYDFAEPTVEYVDPPDEAGGPVLELTDAQLAEEMTCVLTADDPNQPKNIASYSFKAKSSRPQPPLAHGQLAIHFHMVGSSLHIDSDEAKMQIAEENRKKEEAEEARRQAKTDGDEDAMLAIEGGKNQFNYSERAAQTFNNTIRE